MIRHVQLHDADGESLPIQPSPRFAGKGNLAELRAQGRMPSLSIGGLMRDSIVSETERAWEGIQGVFG